MMKTVKGKLVAGAITVALVSSAGGVVFGASDAGSKLKNWYDVQFGNAKQTVEKEANAYWNKNLKLEGEKIKGISDDMKAEIAQVGQNEIDQKGKNIRESADKYIDDLKQERESIVKGMEEQFKGIFEKAEKQFQAEGQHFANTKLEELSKAAGEAGGTEIVRATKELNTVKDRAIQDLRDTIGAAKADLLAKLDSNSIKTKQDLETAVNSEIERIHTVVEGKKEELVKDQEKIITDTALAIQKKAELEMKALVNGIGL